MESDALICDKRLRASSKPAAASTTTTGQADNNKQGKPPQADNNKQGSPLRQTTISREAPSGRAVRQESLTSSA